MNFVKGTWLLLVISLRRYYGIREQGMLASVISDFWFSYFSVNRWLAIKVERIKRKKVS